MSVLAAEDIDVSIGGTRLLREVSCSARVGRLTGLIGPNGAGKSTLVRVLLRLQPVDCGRIRWAGEDITDRRPHELHQYFAYLGQRQTIHWPLTVEAVVALGRRPSLTPFSGLGPADQTAIDRAIEQTGLASMRRRTITSLSGGERTRALLARVLASEAAVVLADEPVAALDPYHQLSILEILKELSAKERAVVIVLHDLSLARRFCDDIILLDKGRVAACGPTSDVLTESNLEPVYRVRLKLFDSGTVLPLSRLS